VAWEWAQIVNYLAHGKTVNDALNFVSNDYSPNQLHQNWWRWKVVPEGGGNVKFQPPAD